MSVLSAQELKIFAVDEPPAAYVSADKSPEGYVVDIVNAMQKTLHDTTSIIFMPEGRGLNIVRDKPNTLLMSISRTPSREHNFAWIAQVMTKQWDVFTLADSPIEISQLDDLRHLESIGVVRGDVREEWLVNAHFANLNSVTLHQQTIQMLALGRVDAIVYENQGLVYQAKLLGIDPLHFKSVYILNRAPVYIVMSKLSSPALIKQWQQAFETINCNGELLKISLHWQIILNDKFDIHSEVENNILVF